MLQQTLALGALTCCGSAPLFLCSPSGGGGDINKCDSEREAGGRKLGLTFLECGEKRMIITFNNKITQRYTFTVH